jgi:hypothetical protein
MSAEAEECALLESVTSERLVMAHQTETIQRVL